jgi:dethiobiotin synthetase
MDFPKKLFISGTDTDIGKTVVSSMLVSGLKAGYWKPIQAGTKPQTDREFVQDKTGLDSSHYYPESYLLNEPMSPHAAAEIDEVKIEMDSLKIPDFTQNHLIIEGAGGLMVPINTTQYVIDLIPNFNIPTLLVAKSGLGTLNHTLLSLEALRSRDIDIFGVILVGEKHLSNEKAIRHYGRVDNLLTMRRLSSIKSDVLVEEFNSIFRSDRDK